MVHGLDLVFDCGMEYQTKMRRLKYIVLFKVIKDTLCTLPPGKREVVECVGKCHF